ncbi:hypothetical protein B0T20DRAFT_475402 [Sordaria brevicollis]|uniref:C3H1-type domain-containing protein n=1 Tax=Sordaria brevicollis TaxID=83679 RepID=A0AAE0PK20_SORBR|nr:hypothetical protein B0T20DRAFT_475402 [Sordaria brevicollis]
MSAANGAGPDYRSHSHMRSGSLNINPNPTGAPPPGAAPTMIASPMPGGQLPGPHRFPEHSRSPPNTSHVPCKFFRQGACQAGTTCPFSHDLSAAAETVCKYFAKGNCKFGPKCANIHVLPDGRRINYGKGGVTIGAPPVALGARVNPNTYHQPSNSALTNSFLRADGVSPYSAAGYGHLDEQYGPQPGQNGGGNGIPTIDTTYTSNPTTAFGSPREDDIAGRFGLGVSPVPKGLSVLDAPLPASFDSNGISHAARYGPWPSSVPEKFGLESSSLGMSVTRDGNTSHALRALRNSAFGGNDNVSQSLFSADGFANSPPAHSAAGFYGSSLGGEEFLGRRPMHSSSSRFAKPKLLSQSVPHDRDWDSDLIFDNEEDYVPGELANELLTPAERARRGSSTATVRGFDADSTGLDATKFGSPISQSPSRWGSLFQRQKEEEEREKLEANGGSGSLSFMPIAGRSIKHPPSAFGHVGSPLRNSSLASAFVSEDSTRQGSLTGESLSALTQQFQRSKIGDDIISSSPRGLHPNLGRNGASGAGVIGKERGDSLQRHISSNSMSSTSGRFATPIINEDNEEGEEEEQSEFVFSMEEEDDNTQAGQNQKRNGSGSPLGNGAGSLGNGASSSSPWGSYAGAAGGANGDEGKGQNGQNGQNGVSKVGAVGAIGGK